MALVNVSIKMEDSLKEQLELLCKDFGMNLSVAFNVFARAVVRERKIPFEISSNLPKLAEMEKIVVSPQEFLDFVNSCNSKDWHFSQKDLALAQEVKGIKEIK